MAEVSGAPTQHTRPAGVKRAALQGVLVAEHECFRGRVDDRHAREGVLAGKRECAAVAAAVDRRQTAFPAHDAGKQNRIPIRVNRTAARIQHDRRGRG